MPYVVYYQSKEHIQYSKIQHDCCVLWIWWPDRNNMIFNEIHSSFYSSWENICKLVGMWSSRHCLFKDYSQITISFKTWLFYFRAYLKPIFRNNFTSDSNKIWGLRLHSLIPREFALKKQSFMVCNDRLPTRMISIIDGSRETLFFFFLKRY